MGTRHDFRHRRVMLAVDRTSRENLFALAGVSLDLVRRRWGDPKHRGTNLLALAAVARCVEHLMGMCG